jgi:peptide deformylase
MIITDEIILRQSCSNTNESEVGAIVEQLERELEYSGRMGRSGIGLSAIQIGIRKNVAIVRIDNNHSVNLVNCKIQNKYDQFKFIGEGCLSFNNLIVNTMRYNEIHVIDNLIYPHSFIATGIMAVAIQHELNHLEGKLLPDFALLEEKAKKVRPNDICICGSGKKFKKCCSK